MPENRALREARIRSACCTEGRGGETEAERPLNRMLGRSSGRSAWESGREAGGGIFFFSNVGSKDLKNLPACWNMLEFGSGLIDAPVSVGLGGDGRSNSSEVKWNEGKGSSTGGKLAPIRAGGISLGSLGMGEI